jgi:hypothetical protein
MIVTALLFSRIHCSNRFIQHQIGLSLKTTKHLNLAGLFAFSFKDFSHSTKRNVNKQDAVTRTTSIFTLTQRVKLCYIHQAHSRHYIFKLNVLHYSHCTLQRPKATTPKIHTDKVVLGAIAWHIVSSLNKLEHRMDIATEHKVTNHTWL